MALSTNPAFTGLPRIDPVLLGLRLASWGAPDELTNANSNPYGALGLPAPGSQAYQPDIAAPLDEVDRAGRDALGGQNWQALSRLIRSSAGPLAPPPTAVGNDDVLADALSAPDAPGPDPSAASMSDGPAHAYDSTYGAIQPPPTPSTVLLGEPARLSAASAQPEALANVLAPEPIALSPTGGLPGKRRPVDVPTMAGLRPVPAAESATFRGDGSASRAAPDWGTQLWDNVKGAALLEGGRAFATLREDLIPKSAVGGALLPLTLPRDAMGLLARPIAAAADQVQQSYRPNFDEPGTVAAAAENLRQHPLFLDPNHTATPAELRGLERAIVGAIAAGPGAVDDLPLPSAPSLSEIGESLIPLIAGRPPRNSGLAGAFHWTGVPFTMRGFPDFASFARHSVQPGELTGLGKTDAKLANAAVGLDKTPFGWTWHHVEDCLTLQLIPTLLHAAVGHTGGVAMMKHGAC